MANQTTAPFRQRCLISCRIGTRPLCSSITTHAPAETIRNVHRHSSVTGPRAELSSFKPTSASQAMNLHRRYRYQNNKMCPRIQSPRHTPPTHSPSSPSPTPPPTPNSSSNHPYTTRTPTPRPTPTLHPLGEFPSPRIPRLPPPSITGMPCPCHGAAPRHASPHTAYSHSMRPEMSRRSSASVLSCFWWRHTGRVFGRTAYAVRGEDWG